MATPHAVLEAPVELRFDAAFDANSQQILLMHLPDTVLSDVMDGRRVVIKGDADQDAVLCTESESYSLQLAETSNSLLLVPPEPMAQDDDAAGAGVAPRTSVFPLHARVSSEYMLKRVCKRLDAAAKLLAAVALCDETEDAPGCAFTDLLASVQCSAGELRKALPLQLRAFRQRDCDDTSWRVLTPTYEAEVLQYILLTIQANSWSYSAVPLRQLLDGLPDFPRPVLRHVMRLYASNAAAVPNDDDPEPADDVSVTMDLGGVCRGRAEQMLRQRRFWPTDLFLQAWQDNLPDDITPDLSMLHGLAIVEPSGTVSYTPLDTLPTDPRQRFRFLFSQRAQWRQVELQAFLHDLVGPSLSMDTLLLRYARPVQLLGRKATPETQMYTLRE